MTFVFTAVLCLGLNLGQETSMSEGNPHKPTLSVQPGLVVAKGKQVTISCEVTTGAREYRLYKEGGPHPWRTRNTPKTTNKAQFLIPSIEQRSGGIYRCYYKTPTGWSEHSDPLELAVTGLYSKPSLSTQPSNVVNSGETVTLQCVSTLGFNRSRSAPQAITKHIRPKDSLTAPELHNGEPHQDGGFNFGPCASWRSSVRSSAQPKADPTCSWERKQCFFHGGRHLGISPRISGGSGRKHLGLQ
ncbi:leukocyte immunoglobulin-like receptor isoform X3 [Mus musculus]|uniref:leukocyte immunoglobulin-like receptor isoform X3 n=1 Tax=Mus musculus TaxID=10090 RepID=UPI0003D75B5B|nr:leukocyte immunoglobulin-like receptor isoform X3 [Mus musculus]|eukprot:XP_006539828.1 PREDICTED: leukocyte immunoglobulin-like receptor isoform X3 [Mus musculus]